MKTLRRLAAGVLAAVVVLIAGLSLFVNANQFRPLLESELTRVLGRPVKVGGLSLSLLSGGVAASDVSVADDPAFSREDFLQARSLAIAVELVPLIFSRQVNITGITVDQPHISLLRSPSGKWNFSTMGAGAAPAAQSVAPARSGKKALVLTASRIRVVGGRVTIGSTQPGVRLRVYDDVNVDIRDFSPASSFPFSLSAHPGGAGELTLNGRAGPLNSADVAMTPVEASIAVKHLDLVAAGLLKPSSGFSGLLAADGNGSSDGRIIRASGRITATGLKLLPHAQPAGRSVQIDFALAHDLLKHAGSLSRGDIHIGAAAAKLTGSWTLEDSGAVLAMNLIGASMPIQELEAMLPALDIVLPAGSSLQGGTARAALAIQGPTDGLVASGTVGLDNTRLAGFDLGSRMQTMARLAGMKVGPDTDIQTFSATVRVAPEGKSVRDIVLIVPAIGNLTGGGTVSPDRALDFAMLARLHTSGVVMALAGHTGDTEVPFRIGGTSSVPTFTPVLKGVMGAEVSTFMKGGKAAKSAAGLVKGVFRFGAHAK